MILIKFCLIMLEYKEILVKSIFKDGETIMFIPEKYCYPKYLVFLADATLNCLFVLCPEKYGCRQFCNTLGRR